MSDRIAEIREALEKATREKDIHGLLAVFEECLLRDDRVPDTARAVALAVARYTKECVEENAKLIAAAEEAEKAIV